jgi:hypothetical protein
MNKVAFFIFFALLVCGITASDVKKCNLCKSAVNKMFGNVKLNDMVAAHGCASGAGVFGGLCAGLTAEEAPGKLFNSKPQLDDDGEVMTSSL